MDFDCDDLEYGDDGIPVLIIEDTPKRESPSQVTSKPPRVKKKKAKPLPLTPEPDDNEVDEPPEPPPTHKYEEDAKAVFNIDGEGYDVILSERCGRIQWSPMNALGRRKKSVRKRSGLFRGRRPSITEETEEEGISLTSLYGAYVKRRRKPGDKEDEGVCEGIMLCMMEAKNENTLRDRTVFMEHPSTELCVRWTSRIMAYLEDNCKRPKNLKVFLQPYAGPKTGRNVFTRTILPLFKAAGICVDLCEIQHNEMVKQEMVHINVDEFDCIVAMGGDGTANQVISYLMNKVQKDKNIEMKQSANPARCPVPVGIIPTGRTNTTAQTVMGVADPVTAALHIIHGHFHPIDICSIYKPDKFLQWGFNCQYGFAGQILTFIRRYKALGSKRVDAAFVKALTKAKLRAYECDIEYIPYNDIDMKSKAGNTPCRTGCKICHTDSKYQDDSEIIQSDEVQELDPLNSSFNSNASSVIDLPQESPWISIKEKYMNVGLFSISGMSDLAPRGLSPNAHLNDGTMDLMLVKETEKKEFVRHLRRFANSKNQFDFPFIEVRKVKEVRFRPRFPMSWNYKDYDYNEIEYQINREESVAATQKTEDVEVIADLESDDEADSVTTLSDVEDENGEKKSEATERPRLVGPQYRKTFMEIEVAKRRAADRKKEEKQKAKEEGKMMSIWNIDNQMVTDLELDIRIHHGLLKICGLGVSPLTEFGDLNPGCLKGM